VKYVTEQSSKVTLLIESSSVDIEEERDKLEIYPVSESEDTVELLFCGITVSINIGLSSSWVTSRI